MSKRSKLFFGITLCTLTSIMLIGLNNCSPSNSDANSPIPTAPSVLVDTDGDSVADADADDNCLRITNANQNDIDRNGIGDLCDNQFIAQVFEEIW